MASERPPLTVLAVHELEVVLLAEELGLLQRELLARAELPRAVVAREAGEVVDEGARASHPIGRLNLPLAARALWLEAPESGMRGVKMQERVAHEKQAPTRALNVQSALARSKRQSSAACGLRR